MQRFDYYNIRAVKTDEGFIKDSPVIGRTGLLEYRNADGSVRIEYRPPEEAFNADSLASIASKPIAMGHKAMVTSKIAMAVRPIGAVLSAGRQDGDNIVADIVIYDELPADIRELSCGYTVDLDETPGVTPDGEHYDAVQRNIRYNHLAVVAKGRAGNARINLDEFLNQRNDGGRNMDKIKFDSGLEYEVQKEVVVEFEKITKERNDALKERDTFEAGRDALQIKLDAAEKENAKLKEGNAKDYEEAVNARLDVLEIGGKLGIEGLKEKTNDEIKKAVIAKVHGDVKLDGKSDDYIQAMYDMAKDTAVKQAAAQQRKDMNDGMGTRNDDADDLDAIMRKLREDEANAWSKEV